ncbi:hypothetical protein HY085_00730 [Candidatus Gottesmanbacteria bacterium]|nr:hypothetical protein [Candidatus Gottesmanbacteria bacterium]
MRSLNIEFLSPTLILVLDLCGVPAGVADIAESLVKGNFPQLKTKLEEMGLPFTASLDLKRKWWSENWKAVRSYSKDELKNDFKNLTEPRS